MAATLKITENTPETYPAIELPFEAPNDEFVPALWRRIESYIRHRWGERDVVFIVEGPGDWTPPMEPATIETVESWRADAWETATLSPSPLGGYVLDGAGPYRFTGAAGSDETPPGDVQEAFRRLAQFFVSVTTAAPAAGLATAFTIDELRVELSSPNAAARAIQHSGAGDLLRRYRKLGGV